MRTPRPRVPRLGRPIAARFGLAVVGLVAAAALGGCASSSGGAGAPVRVVTPSASASGLQGAPLDPPVTLSAVDRTASFASSAGGTTTLADLQRGRLMLLYFGYTNCPDICPTTMADLGQALRSVPPQVRAHTQVVFVTSDPDRDTPAVLKRWLANFDTGLPLPFVGLTASATQTDALAKAVGVTLSPAEVSSDGTVSVEHGTQTLAFVDGSAPLEWLFGTKPGAYAHDIGDLAARLDASS